MKLEKIVNIYMCYYKLFNEYVAFLNEFDTPVFVFQKNSQNVVLRTHAILNFPTLGILISLLKFQGLEESHII